MIFNNISDIESTSDSNPKSNHQGINFEQINNNDLYKNSFQQKYSTNTEKHVTFQGLDIEKNIKNTNFSLINYINNNYKTLESKYINRFKNHNLLSYNYNQLKSNEYNSGETMLNSSSNISKDFNNNQLKKLRYFNSSDKNIEQQSNLLENNDSDENDLEENAPLNV